MQNKSLRVLEFDKILNIMADLTSSEPVRVRILALMPTSELSAATHAQSETTEAANMLLRFGYPQNLSAPNVVPSLKRADIGGVLSPKELLDIARLLNMSRSVKKYLLSASQDEFPVLSGIESGLFSVKALEERIYMCILSEEEIADAASSELSSIRRKIRNLQDKIKDTLNSIIRSAKYQKYLQDPIVTMRSSRYVIPVKSEYRGEVAGVVHDTSSSGATLFVEPMSVVNANNEIRDLAGKEEAEIERILAELSAEVSEYVGQIESNYKQICELDFIFCKGKLSLKFNCTEPALNGEGRIYLKKARHPLIEAKNVVANDIYMGGDFDTLVVTGPNTGGKTVTLKTLGLFCLMAAAGLHIPANDGSEVAVFNKVWADIGDEQSIEQSLSTFSSHMTNIVNIIDNIDTNSLALFDELGAGTDPVEGAALAVSILEYLRLVGAKTAATTHYSELKLFALSTPGVCNASCEFDVKTLKPTYKLLIGIPGKSNAFAISERLGLSLTIIERAKSLMTEDNLQFEDIISGLEQSKNIADAEKNEAAALKQEVAKLKDMLAAQKERLETNRQKLLDQARHEAKRIVEDAKDESAAIIKELNALKKHVKTDEIDKAVEAARSKMREKEKALDVSFSDVLKPAVNNRAPKSLKPGDSVEILSISQNATVLAKPDADGNVQVQAGIMKINAHISGLRLLSDSAAQNAKKPIVSGGKYTSKKSDIKTELDLRGFSLDEALIDADRFIHDAYMAGLSQVSIIHGKGTGVLRKGVTDMLRTHKQVKSHRIGAYGEGDSGVTIVELN